MHIYTNMYTIVEVQLVPFCNTIHTAHGQYVPAIPRNRTMHNMIQQGEE